MALILINERKIRCDTINRDDKQFTVGQILKPASLAVMRKAKNASNTISSSASTQS